MESSEKLSREAFAKGRLLFKPKDEHLTHDIQYGVYSIGLDKQRDGLFYIPQSYQHHTPAGLAVMLHGAGGDAQQALKLLQPYSDLHNIILLAPVSRKSSWDIISDDSFGPDVFSLNEALHRMFDEYSINTSCCAIGGFSDGASYALSIGLLNGDLFTHIIAFSPGFYYAPHPTGKPSIFISHGTQDSVLPIDSCSRRIVSRLENNNYKFVYNEFVGMHTVPEEVSSDAVRWFVGKS